MYLIGIFIVKLIIAQRLGETVLRSFLSTPADDIQPERLFSHLLYVIKSWRTKECLLRREVFMILCEEDRKWELDIRLVKPINGYWDHGAKDHFVWTFDCLCSDPEQGIYCVGSWEANYRFTLYLKPHKLPSTVLRLALNRIRRTLYKQGILIQESKIQKKAA